jgi:hypothetical protein
MIVDATRQTGGVACKRSLFADYEVWYDSCLAI